MKHEQYSFDRILPHTGAMLMLTKICLHKEHSIRCACTIKENNPLLVAGKFPMSAGIELFAQTAGIFFGRRRKEEKSGDQANAGAVVQVKSFTLLRQNVPVGSELFIDARYMGGSADAIMMEGSIEFEGSEIFAGRLMIAIFSQDNQNA